MLRHLEVVEHKPVIATAIAGGNLVTGMAVMLSSGEYIAASTPIYAYFADKERVTNGINAARTNYSDYFEDFVNIADGELFKVVPAIVGELYATDQHDFKTAKAIDDLSGSLLTCDNGKWKVLSGNEIGTRFMCEGSMVEGDHLLIKIRVYGEPIKNAG